MIQVKETQPETVLYFSQFVPNSVDEFPSIWQPENNPNYSWKELGQRSLYPTPLSEYYSEKNRPGIRKAIEDAMSEHGRSLAVNVWNNNALLQNLRRKHYGKRPLQSS